MRLAELSERSGVSTATIKYYLREGLLPPGRQVNATTAEYEEEHVRRLRLVRALIQVGRIPVATAKEVLGHVDDESLGRTMRLGAALWALPQPPEPAEDDAAVTAARREVDRLLAEVRWDSVRELGDLSPVHRSLVTTVATLIRLGYDWNAEELVPYARLMREVAARDLDFLETHESDAEKAEMAVAAAVLFEPVLRALHRLAQEEESARRYGIV
ncbi:MerR family transcriptional regulator [Streptomyces sp. C1-2]|uniref:MerR family transcriptional regulator n=1 Tax=Streptomyces sp. C1-2 TaxID=2720022 RepID=UPI0014323FA6|nr:MerR family transcriptional regulator [Streptomyces sp. C1-2]NJP71476.1 MerR family transcriptional regulator [Streptomyces sp. C1-2]